MKSNPSLHFKVGSSASACCCSLKNLRCDLLASRTERNSLTLSGTDILVSTPQDPSVVYLEVLGA